MSSEYYNRLKRKVEASLGEQEKKNLQELLRLTEEQCGTDHLTGLLLRGIFIEKGERQLARARYHNIPTALLVADIDCFKQVNDKTGYAGLSGHAAGDRLLQDMKKVIDMSTRPGDLTARIGGEEFAILLDQASLDIGYQVSERLLRNMKKVTGHTLSIGLAEYNRQDPHDTLAKLLYRADEALYRAKESGRNQVVILR